MEWLDENPNPFTLHELVVGALRLSESDADRFKNRVAALLHRLGYDWDRKRLSGTAPVRPARPNREGVGQGE